MKERGAFRILNDTYVTEESGTGVVHQAPYFGEVSFPENILRTKVDVLIMWIYWNI